MQVKPLTAHLNNFDIIRVLGICLVVLRHSFAPFTGSWGVGEFYNQSNTTAIIGEYISTVSMPLFVFISGYIFSYLRNSLNKYGTFKILLVKKAKRLLVPYLILAPLYIYFFLDANGLKDYLWLMTSGPGHLWFLIMIFILFITFYPLEEFLKSHFKFGLLLVLFLYSLEPITHYFGLEIIAKVFKYIPFFYLGYLFNYHREIVGNLLKNKGWIIFIMHSALFVFFILSDQYITNKIIGLVTTHYTVLMLGFLSITFVYVLFQNATYQKSSLKGEIIAQINNNSYYIYLIHQPILKLFFLSKFIQLLPVYLVIPIAFIVAFGGSFLLSKPLLRFKYGRMLIGAK